MARNVTDLAHMLNVIATKDPADPMNVTAWQGYERANPGAVDFTKSLNSTAIWGKKFGVLRDLFNGDPEINALAEKALDAIRALGGQTVDIKLDPEFVEFHLKSGVKRMRELSDYRFRVDWEQYLATFRNQNVPRTVEAFIKVYEDEVMKSPLPVEDSVMNLQIGRAHV